MTKYMNLTRLNVDYPGNAVSIDELSIGHLVVVVRPGSIYIGYVVDTNDTVTLKRTERVVDVVSSSLAYTRQLLLDVTVRKGDLVYLVREDTVLPRRILPRSRKKTILALAAQVRQALFRKLRVEEITGDTDVRPGDSVVETSGATIYLGKVSSIQRYGGRTTDIEAFRPGSTLAMVHTHWVVR